MTKLIPPSAFGLPEKFGSWRQNQEEAIFSTINAETRFSTQIAPTGFGKSLTYVATAIFKGGRTVILTSTKGLQTQLLKDFESIGAVDIRGKNAYACALVNDGTTRCDQGPCIAGAHCAYKDGGGCHYYNQLKMAIRSNLVITNYAYWMTNNKYAEGLGQFDFMVCDEAHGVPNAVSNFLTIRLDRTDTIVSMILPRSGDLNQMSVHAWKAWAKEVVVKVEVHVEELSREVRNGAGRSARRKLSRLKALKSHLSTLVRINDTWAIDINKFSISFAPIWPAPYCEESLFLDVKSVLLTSASVCEKTVDMLGVDSKENGIIEYPHTFPAQNRMLIHIPTIRLNRHTTDMEMRQWMTKIDQILRGRQDRKGIIHTVSYDRRNLVITHSNFKEFMMTHKRIDTEKVVERFKLRKPPAVLVSPSMTTGWDFPDDTCRYQIIGKIAYPDTRNVIVKARTEDDKDYTSYEAMQQLIQACGRSVRSKTDWSENFIIDDNITWFIKRYGKFAPRWFTDAFRGSSTIPKPPKM